MKSLVFVTGLITFLGFGSLGSTVGLCKDEIVNKVRKESNPGENFIYVGEFNGKIYFRETEYGRTSSQSSIYYESHDLEKVFIDSLEEFNYLVENLNSTASHWIVGAAEEVPQSAPCCKTRICADLWHDWIYYDNCGVAFKTICQNVDGVWTTESSY